jgi:glucan biosynthesis protein C
MLYRQRDALHLHARFGKTYLLIASLVFGITLPMIQGHLTVPFTGLRLACLALLLALFASFTTFGLFAIFLRTSLGNNPLMRYLSAASFWIYLIHLPFVVLTQIAIAQLPVPTVGKFLLAGSTALALSLMTYHVYVRKTWLGQFLDGHRQISTLLRTDPEPAYIQCPVAAPGFAMEKRLSTVSVYGANRNTNGGIVS